MSQLGKIFLYAAVLGAAVAAVAGGLLVEKRGEDTANLAQAVQAKQVSDQAARKAQADIQAANIAKADVDKQLTDANSNISDLKTQLTAAQKQATDAATAQEAATEAAKAAQDKLDAINATLKGANPDDLVKQAKQAQDDLTAAQSEQKILQDSLQASQQQVADLETAINNSKTGKMPGVSGKVTFVDRVWNFVILDVGLSNGVVPNGELIVYRGRDFLGKVRVTKVDPNDSVAEILPDIKGDIQIGDAVLN